MNVPAGYTGPEIEIIERDMKQEAVDPFVDRVMTRFDGPGLQKVGLFLDDKEDCDLTKLIQKKMTGKGSSFVNMKDFIDQANSVKTPSELQNIKIASEFTEWTFNKIIEEVEAIFEYDKQVKHSHIQKKIESCLEEENLMISFMKTHPNLDTSFLEYPIPVAI
jgi:Xaa-Pro aminopeptidase